MVINTKHRVLMRIEALRRAAMLRMPCFASWFAGTAVFGEFSENLQLKDSLLSVPKICFDAYFIVDHKAEKDGHEFMRGARARSSPK